MQKLPSAANGVWSVGGIFVNHKIAALAVTVALIAGFFVLPGIVRSQIPQVSYTRGTRSDRVDSISCQGFLEAGDRAEIYITAPVVTDTVHVSVGDRVSHGDVLCTINKAATQAVLASPQISAQLLEEYFQSGSVSASELSALVAGNAGEGFQFAYQPEYLSPVSGTVTEVNITGSTLYNSAAAAIVIEDLDTVKATVYVPQADILGVEVGDHASVYGDGISGNLSGIVTAISPSAIRMVSTAGTEALIPVEITLNAPAGQARPNYAITADLYSSVQGAGTLVPYQAVKQDEENNEYVQVLGTGYRVEKRIVTTGEETAEQTEILSGLQPGDIIILDEVEENTLVRLGESMDGD